MSVDAAHVESECPELFLQVTESHHLIGRTHRLESIFVDDHHEIAQLEVSREVKRLPHGSLVHLAVADHRVAILGRCLAARGEG